MNNRQWNSYCGDKDLWDKYTHVEMFDSDRKNMGAFAITKIFRDKDNKIHVRTPRGSFPFCEEKRPGILETQDGFTLELVNTLEQGRN